MTNKSTPESILQNLMASNAQKVKLAITDIDGILRGKMVSIDKFSSISKKGFGFCEVVFGWDAADMAYDNANQVGWHTGYCDALATVDLRTYRQVPWENNLPFFLADFSTPASGLQAICPRSLLRTIAAEALAAGFFPNFSQEFEWFNFKNNSRTGLPGQTLNPEPMTTGMFGYSILRASQQSDFFLQLFDQLTQFGIPIEGLHTETGPGVYEAAILYTNVLEAADRAVLFKSGVKEIAHRQGLIASFMAKWNEHLPGCSGHVHQSLWSIDQQQNLFADELRENGISQLMESYIAGQLYCLPYILPMYAPTINSFKRLVPGAWAPTTISWGIDNRTTALRVIGGSGGQSTRLETRVVGSDSNPYLAMAACLASGLYGIKNQLKLTTAATIGNGYANPASDHLPGNLWDATQAMKNSTIAKQLFGETFVQHFVGTREWEWRQFSNAVTDWEMKRYFEII